MTRSHARFATVMALTLTTATALSACQEDSGPTVPRSSSSSATSSAGTAPGAQAPAPQRPMADLSRYVGQQVSWSEDTCPSSMRVVTALSDKTTCARITAPKDYFDPGKGDITLMVARTKSDNPDARVLFTNPGGPGAPAARFSAVVAKLSPLAQTHDVIGVDPRGTGDSTSVSCDPPRTGVDDNRNLTPAQVTTVQSRVKKSVTDCVAKHGGLLPFLTSDNTARDHDLVRRILGAGTVDYYGVSAGTWLGSRYATLFPKQVGRFVLDSNTEFTAPFAKTFGNQPMAFQRRWDQQFLPWAARHDATYGLGTDNRAVNGVYEKVRKAAGEGRLDVFTPSLIDNVLASEMYGDPGFVSAATLLGLLDKATDGDPDALRQAKRSLMSSGGDGYTDYRESTTFMAVTCNDTPWNKQPLTYAANAFNLGKKYPLTGYDVVENRCAYWPYTAPQTKVDVSKAPPMMMVQTELDPATSYENAMSAHRASPSTRMLVVDNQGDHGAVVGSKNACVTTAAYDFLTKGKLIAQDSVCPAVPLPDDSQVFEVGSKAQGPQLPTADGYARQKPNLAQQVIDLLLRILAEATHPQR
ncbi:alpha/beta hydrolase [Barrientosiimonas endolithica]|uniref:Peptidase n=1 Tax=Barrientosiimonas endolithica TaxID=1535208 RepID=A0ABN6YKC8_9MICO|nr:alpha/beta hydrolase [Barrientosiimonas endolithica]BDZ56357.1 peptidase [Barrientosiimonas endolithica]